MTGFGRASADVGGVTVTVEIKSVNHRYLEPKFERKHRNELVYGKHDAEISRCDDLSFGAVCWHVYS